jgi:hypothetical protein
MPYDHDEAFDWSKYDPPTKPSPSGIFPLNEFGEQLLAKITPADGEPIVSWLTRLESAVPQIGYGAPVPKEFRQTIQNSFQGALPSLLLELWRYAPGIEISHDQFLWDPGRFVNENRFHVDHVPEIMTSMVFFGGSDGFNGAVALGNNDLRGHEWSHEEGFTGQTTPTMMHYIAERIAWYATTFQPFCYQHGYVRRQSRGKRRVG